jgi:hypothetical protein
MWAVTNRSFALEKHRAKHMIADGIAVAQAFAKQFVIAGSNTPQIG